MSGEIGRNYDPGAIEAEASRIWTDERCFAADPAGAGDPYSIVIPPPNVTGALHLGHAVNNTLQDILTRVHRMRGFNTVWIPGIDHAGIATQAVVEKQLKEKENKTRHDVGREELVRRIWQWKEQYGIRIIEQLKRLGCSCDWDRTRFTLDEQCARAVRETFFKLFKDGLIYRGKRLVNWDVHLQTSISDDEIYHETVKTSLWHIRYPIVDEQGIPELHPDHKDALSRIAERNKEADVEGKPKLHATYKPAHLVVATTRPETMLGDTAVAVHSQDERWNWAIGKFVKLPLTGRKIPIIADDILVDPKFGSGVVKVTPAHDPNDYAVWQRHQGKPDQIDLINILQPDGTLNENAGPYANMKRDAARKKVVEDLTAAGLLAKEEPYETQVGHSDRSKTPVEPYLSDQWFVKMAPLAEPALEVVRNGAIKFFPERHAQQYLAWLGEKRDWPISRQLWWGHRIPVWSKTLKDEKLKIEESTWLPTNGGLWNRLGASDWFELRPETKEMIRFVCPPPEKSGQIVPLLEADGFTQDPDVLDTWFSSGLWPHSTLGWPEDTPELREWYPTSVLATGRDIISLWVARMVMLGLFNMKEVPFHHVYINTTILDGKGERMSKSKNNGVDPIDVIETHGADALRFTLTTMATETQDVRMPVKRDAQGRNTSDKFDIGRNFANKIWNVATAFVIPNLVNIEPDTVEEGRWSLADRWIVSRFNHAVFEANAALAIYRFDQYAKTCYDFFWNDFCGWYVEVSKPALRAPETAGQTAEVLAAVLDGALRLMHPMIPFITEAIWGRLNEARPYRGLPVRLECPGSRRLIHAAWPAATQYSDPADAMFARIQEMITAIRKMRNDFGVDLKRRLNASIRTPTELMELVENNRSTIEQQAGCRILVISDTLPPVPGVANTSAGGCDIFLHDLQNEVAQQSLTEKRAAELTRTIEMLEARLSGLGYITRAPAALVQQSRDQLAQARAELEKLRNQSIS